MNDLILLLICILSVEVFHRFNFLASLTSIINITKKVADTLTSKSISDHWKEIVIPVYALKIMKHSFQILLILVCITSLLLTAELLLNGFIVFTLSFSGVFASAVFASGYVSLRKSFGK